MRDRLPWFGIPSLSCGLEEEGQSESAEEWQVHGPQMRGSLAVAGWLNQLERHPLRQKGCSFDPQWGSLWETTNECFSLILMLLSLPLSSSLRSVIFFKGQRGLGWWIEHQPVNQRVAGMIPSQGPNLGCEPVRAPSGGRSRGNHT